MSGPQTRAVNLNIAYSSFAEIAMKGLLEGSILIEGCNSNYVQLKSGEMLTRSFQDASFNVAELSLSNYLIYLDTCGCDYVALPIYNFRAFQFANFYVRYEAGISTPQQLKGRRVAINAYHHTSYVWSRYLLESEYGVKPTEINWVFVTHENVPSEESIAPPYVNISRPHSNFQFSELLESGEVDAAIVGKPPACSQGQHPKAVRLFLDPKNTSQLYYRRRNVFPIVHVLGVRKNLLKQGPKIADWLMNAFIASKALSIRTVSERDGHENDDSFTPPNKFGLGENERRVLDLFLDSHFEQGLSSRRYRIDEIFDPLSMSPMYWNS